MMKKRDQTFHVEHCNAHVDSNHVHLLNVVQFVEVIFSHRNNFSN